MNKANFEELTGKTIDKIEIVGKDSQVDYAILFYTSDNKIYKMFHEQECCEQVLIQDICGNFDDILHKPIIVAEKVTNDNKESGNFQYRNSITWTFYKLITEDECVTITWKGSSNGFYSEEVDFTVEE